MINFLASLNWTAIIITTTVCITMPRCLVLTFQIATVLRDISKTCVQMEELRQRAKTDMR